MVFPFFHYFSTPTSVQISDRQWKMLQAKIACLQGLDQQALDKLRGLVTQLLKQKKCQDETGNGQQNRLLFATLACLPVLNLGLEWLSGWKKARIVREHSAQPAHYNGATLIASPDELEQGTLLRRVCATIDQLDGVANGLPPLHSAISQQQWQDAFSDAWQDFCQRVTQGPENEILFDTEASQSLASFFAVISEAFFYTADAVRCAYPDVYALLVHFYRQNPAAMQNMNTWNPYAALLQDNE